MDPLGTAATAILAAGSIDDVIAPAQQGELARAWAELERRSRPGRVSFGAWLARRGGLPVGELDDAQARAVAGIREAVVKDDLGRGPDPHGRQWKASLKKVIAGRLHNYLRSYRRAERGLDRRLQAEEVLTGAERPGRKTRPGSRSGPKSWPG